mgnify:CR=1 FL=1
MKLLLLVSAVISSLAVNVLATPLPRAIEQVPSLGLISSDSGNQETPFSGAFKPDPELPYVDFLGKYLYIFPVH